MAELLLADEWAESSDLEIDLREFLSDDYFVVAGPKVRGLPLDAVVVGPPGLCVLYLRDWPGEIRPAPAGPWPERLVSGQEVQHPNPLEETNEATTALRAFLRDEFPELHPGIRHLLVLTSPEAILAGDARVEPVVVYQSAVAETIGSLTSPTQEQLADGEVREALALALQERQLTTTQRASEPFVFRSGGLFGSGKKVWTIQAAVRHMDRHPEDGTLHLQNGTLALWLSEQGAEHLALLAQEVVQLRQTDPRVMLETFLAETGLVDLPRFSVLPRRVDLGCVLSGKEVGHRFKVRKARGRGYLFGDLSTSEPWLRVEPKSFSGGPLDAVVAADTRELSISRRPWQAEILIDSFASAEPVSVPVRVRVVGMPSRLNRFVLRPLAGALIAGLLGGVLGWCLGRWVVGAQGVALAGWTAFVGLIWAFLGGARGWSQPVDWPISYALGRWLSRFLVWSITLTLGALLAHWAWRELGPTLEASLFGASSLSVALVALSLAIVPSVWGQIRAARRWEEAPEGSTSRPWLRPLVALAIMAGLTLFLVFGGRLLAPAWQDFDLENRASTAQEWGAEQWGNLEKESNEWFSELYIRYYDRRAPVRPTPTGTAAPTVRPTAVGGAP